MSQEVTEYIQKLPAWQVEVCEALRKLIHETIPDVEERLQYGKPHFLKNGHYASVITTAKGKVSFMLFNAGELAEVKGYFKSMATPDRKTATITEGQTVDYAQLGDWLRQTSAGL